jgi:hypothetical protein
MDTPRKLHSNWLSHRFLLAPENTLKTEPKWNERYFTKFLSLFHDHRSILPIASNIHEGQEMEPTIYRATSSEQLAVSGIKDTVWALNEGHVRKLVVCANLASSAGWRCPDCLSLYGGIDVEPEKCLYCGSVKIYTADLREEMIERAYRLGCSIEVRSRCPELERVGGIGALLHETCSKEPARRAASQSIEKRERAG